MNPLKNILGKLRDLAALARIAINWYSPLVINVMPFVDQSKQVMVRMRNGSCYVIRPKNGEIMILNEVLYHQIYSKYFPISGITLDIGANTGVFSVYASKQAEQVIAFEPCPSNYDILKKNLDLNRVNNVYAFQNAIAGKNERRKLSIDPDTSGGHTFYPFLSNFTETMYVMAITLEDVFVQNKLDRIDFLKMDCEGAELEILENASDELLKRIDRMVIECHRGNGAKIIELLTKNDFSVVYGDKSTLYASKDPIDCT